MLPVLKTSQSKLPTQQESRITLKKSTISKTTKTLQQVQSYYDKCQHQLELNRKLKQLLTSLKSNVDISMNLHKDQQQVAQLIKQRKKEETNAQHQAHILNIIISDNNKLKEEVDSERNKRAIYFNVYKNLEHQIHHWESKYKNLLIQSMKSEGAIAKIKQKFRKATKKMERDIQSLNNQIQQLSKTETFAQKETKQVVKTVRTKNSKSPTFIQVSQPGGNTDSLRNMQIKSIQNENSQFLNSLQNRKSTDFQLQYDLEKKTIEVAGCTNRLKAIAKTSDLHQAYKTFKGLDQNIDYYYNLFKQQQKRQKELSESITKYQRQLNIIQTQNFQRKSTKLVNLEGQKQISNYSTIIFQLQKCLKQKIGVKVETLSNEMLLHHCLRIRDQKKQGRKNLQKYLQQTKKQKPQHNILLSPKQMHRKIIQGQTNII